VNKINKFPERFMKKLTEAGKSGDESGEFLTEE
jgi:hypothetical protein